MWNNHCLEHPFLLPFETGSLVLTQFQKHSIVIPCWRGSRPSGSAVEVSVFQYTYTRTTNVLWGKRDSAATLSRGENLSVPRPLPQGGRAKSLGVTSLYRFLRPLTSKVLFTIQRFVLGGYFCRYRREVTEYIKGGHLQCKWLKGLCPIPGGSSPDSGKIKILSKHLLPQFRVREFF